MATKKLTTVVIDALEDIKARDIKLINVSKLTSVFDYIAVASADSTRQTKALAKNVMDQVKEFGGWIYGTEGEQSGEWVLVDCGDVVVHIMQPAVREHYKLEELWGDGKVEFPKPAAAPRARKAPVVAAKKVTAKKPSAMKKKPVAKKTAAAKPVAVKKVSETVKTTVKKVAKTVAKTKTVARKKPAPTVKKSTAKTATVARKKPAATKPATARRRRTASE